LANRAKLADPLVQYTRIRESDGLANPVLQTSSGRTTPFKHTECLQTNIEADVKTITAYLVKERALEAVQAAE